MSGALFNLDAIRPADLLHVRSNSFVTRAGTKVLSDKKFKVQGFHDALVLGGLIGVGESVFWPPFACTTPWEDYEEKMRAGQVAVSILRVPGLTPADRQAIVGAWYREVRGTFYDFMAFPRLLIKATVIDVCPRAAGWEWAHFCTEGCQKSFRVGTKSRIDPWRKDNSTPGTTEHRVYEGDILDVSESCLTEEGRQYRLILKTPTNETAPMPCAE